jgi:hypothetical protein
LILPSAAAGVDRIAEGDGEALTVKNTPKIISRIKGKITRDRNMTVLRDPP